MARAVGLACVRCGAEHALRDYAVDCAKCHAEAPANLAVRYDGPPLAGLSRDALPAEPRTIWRWAGALPVDAADAVSLGEGGTPLVHAPAVARELRVGDLWIKDESRNPTWSFKDRLASVAISAARALGARVIASSSSGNAGAAVAAYAARAGLPCIVFTFSGTAGPMVTQMRAYGAMVLAVSDKAHRWPLLEAGVRRWGWFPTSPFFGPVVGSNPLGLEGYKTLAYEVAQQLDWQVPDWCVLPVCYGDALAGMARGFDEMLQAGWIARRPRLVAAEVYGSLERAQATGGDALPDMPKTHDSVAVSIGATRSTYQALRALRDTQGVAVRVPDEEMLAWQARLARREGLWIEPSSAAPLGAVRLLRERGVIGAGDRVVAVATASGLKDPAATAARLPEVPVVPPSVDAAAEALHSTYGFVVEP